MMPIDPSSILKVTFETTDTTFQDSSTWVINTRKDEDYLTLTVTDTNGDSIVPTSITRANTVYILVFSQEYGGKAVFEY